MVAVMLCSVSHDMVNEGESSADVDLGIKCHKCFNIDYALILEDKDGNRAAPIMDDPEMVV